VTKKSERAGRVDYDNLFKTAMKDYFWEGLQIFLPELYEAADRSVPVKFLDQELQKVTLKLGGGRRRIDMLAEIQLEGGKKELVLCHIEIQGKGGRDLALRMMRYRSAIFLQYGREPVGIAVITGNRPRREKRFYSSELFGVETFYKYKNVVILDIPDEVLLAGNNRVGFVLYAAKCAAKSGKDEGKKFHYLRLISDLWNAAGWSPHDKRVLLEMVNYLLNLQDQDYVEQIVKYQENLTMKKEDREMFVSMFERVYTARGREEGIQQGLRQGKQEIAKNLLADGMALEVVARNTGLPMDDIRALAN
jgi:hypothetical protein